MKIVINILFWDNGEKERLCNTNLSWYMLNKFCVYAQEKGLDIEPFLFDFSEDKVINEAIHIPYPKGVYKRSEKINKVINYHSDKDVIFSVMDSDLILKESEYDAYIYLLKTLKLNNFYVFNLDDLVSTEGVDFENKKIDYSKIQTQQRQMCPDLGALFFINLKILEEVGGFDERFTVYGGEDNDASFRLQEAGFKKIILPLIPYHLPHINLMDTVVGTEEYKKQVNILYNDRKKVINK